ncbi:MULTISPECIES: ComEC/Rec2 family competence protein [Gordonia]|nr:MULTISPECIES: ComEC/Rec2 family competence protein [Gordonia]ATD71550.1 competence protein ComEC [Gordonia sp. 1D]MBA5849397.1 ComEC/Rec2 family competence protein [Gordonia amicalis]MDV7099792.1 ComEC/Rec2 family competence protein [Gordonia amicalis]NKX78602.1 ComEC/Rec2 family competence protein [Gordonia amicalis]GAC51816.1 putative ComEC/Rec2-related protein [Gordonia amicalis NBRC 100051 = JCM 11271]
MDFRLLVPAVMVWSVTACGLVAPVGVGVGVAIVSAVVALAGVLACGAHRLGWEAVGLVVVGAGLAAACATSLSLRQEARADHPLSHVSGKATVVMTLRSDPLPIGPTGQGRIRARVDVEQIGTERVSTAPADLRGATQAWAGLLPGQRVVAVVKVRPPPDRTLLVASLTASSPKLVGGPPAYQTVAGSIRQRLQLVATRALGPEAAGLLPGLVLGDESGVDEGLRDDFRAAGLSHLTAVSGANFAIVCGAALLIVRSIGVPPRSSAIVGLVVIVGFVMLVRPTPSVLRAALMGGVGVLALFASRRSQSLPALGAAVIGGLLWWPELALQPGFALSVAATCAIVLWAPRLRDRLRAWRCPPGLAEVIAMAVTAQVVTAPIVVLVTGQLSVVGIVANLLVAPVVAIISVVGTAAALIGAIGPPDGLGAGIAELLVRALGPELWWMIWCAHTFGGPGWASVEVLGWASVEVLG